MKKIYLGILIVGLVVITAGAVVAQGPVDRKPAKVVPSGQIINVPGQALGTPVIQPAPVSASGVSRIIINKPGLLDKTSLWLQGCKKKQELTDEIAIECPAGLAEKMLSQGKARKDRIFKILDLGADQQIQADLVWAQGVEGTDVNVVILDTGIDSNHIELIDSIIGQHDFVDNDDEAEDTNGHGTHVAGIITGNGILELSGKYATGVAPKANIYMLKVCGSDGYCWESNMEAAMNYAIDNIDAKVMNISIGGGNFSGENCDSDSLAIKVNNMVDNGYTVVVSAGNDGLGVSSPACASKVIAVGAVDKSGTVPYWSNRGSALDILGPGVDVWSTYSCLAAGDCGSYWYASMGGTSMASPHIAGVVALLLETKPTATDSEIKTAIYSTATPANRCYQCTRWSGWGCRKQRQVACTPEIEGAGIVNAYQAYLAIQPTGPKCSENQDCTDAIACTIDTCLGQICQHTPDDSVCSADAWVDTGSTQWVASGTCQEKEQTEQEYQDYYCNVSSDCQYNVTNTQWIDTGETRSIPGCGEETKCWSADYQYLKSNRSQARKFCKCVAGIYDYEGYSRVGSRQNAYQYTDSVNNENWQASLSANSRKPIDSVECSAGIWYPTNKDYYYSP